MYDKKMLAFLDVQEPGSRRIEVMTAGALFPLDCDCVPQNVAEAVVAAHLQRGGSFDVPWPLPTVGIDDPSFFRGETPFLWRGPTWSVVNWFLARAFRTRGFNVEAEPMRDSLCGPVERSGFREYYDPLNGAGLGARDFTWSGLLVDM